MQFLREDGQGNRIRVSKDQWLVDKHQQTYCQLVSIKGALIYHMEGRKHKPVNPPSYRYGGRGRAWKAGSPDYGFC